MTLMGDEYKLDNLPNDCIQSVKFGPKDDVNLLVASWDGTVRLYDVKNNQLKTQYSHDAPVLDATFQDIGCCWSGGCDNQVKKYDFSTQTGVNIGSHSEPVRCVEYVPDVNLVISGGWDSCLKFWDIRQAGNNVAPVATHKAPEKVYSMAVCGDKLIVGTAGRRVIVWDLRNMNHDKRESSLKYQTRFIKAFPNRQGYVLSSIEGRVAIEYMDLAPEVQKKKYAFKCHRNKDNATGLEIIYPVNAISFHNRFGTFATGGSDGYVNIWDGQNKKRLVQFHRYPTSISSLSFSPDGNLIAIASSYLYENDDADKLGDIPPDSIYIRHINEIEVKPK